MEKTKADRKSGKRSVPSETAYDPRALRDFYDKASPWVSRGAIYGFELHEELTEPTILESESAICALTVVSTGAVLGLTTGRRSHAFYFHPAFHVVDLGTLSEEPVAGGAVVSIPHDVVVGGWHGEKGGLFRHDASIEFGTGQEDFYPRKAPIERIPLPEKKEGILALAHHPVQRAVYGLTTRSTLIRLDDRSRKVRVVAEVGFTPSPVLLVMPDGSLLGAGEEGQLWRHCPGQRKIEKLDAFGPSQKGKRYVAAIQTLLLDRSGMVYGGTSIDGLFFSYNPSTRTIINLGKPHRQSHIRALTEGHDGVIYGIVEEPQSLAHLFTFDPRTRGFEDLGLVGSSSPVQWTAHSLGALCTGLNGEIFLGESDTLSHLFIYYPPVVRRSPSTGT